MQKGNAKHILSAICALFSVFASAQTSLQFQTPDGFSAEGIKLVVYSPFALELRVRYDSTQKIFLIDEEFNRVVATAKGYVKFDSIFKAPVPTGSKLVLQLTPESQVLDEIVISTNKSGTKLKESPVSITIVKPYLIQNKVTADMTQLMDQVPGVTITDNQINIRNGTGWSYGAGSRVAVLIDDLPMLSADAASPQFSFMPLENVGSVEVVKSAGSVLYGSSALNGIVNLRTADPGDKPTASAAFFSGFYGTPPRDSLKWTKRPHTISGANGYYSEKRGNTGFSIAWNILADEGYRQKEMNYRGRLTLRLKHESNKINGLSYGINTSAQRGFSGSFLLWENYGHAYAPPKDGGYTYTNTSRISIDPFVTWRLAKTTHKLLNRVYLLDNAVDNGNANNNQSNGSSLWYNEYKITHWMLKDHLIYSGGAVAMLAETHSPLFSGNQTSRNLATYSQLEYRMKHLIATAGARYEYFKLNKYSQSRPVFRAGLNYALARFTNLRASWGQGYRFPSMAESFTTTTVGALTIFPNPNLKPEFGNSAEIGIKQGYRIGNFKAYLDVAAYRMVMNDMMEFTFAQWGDISGPFLGLGFKSLNVGKCQISGYEIETAGEGKIGKVIFNILGGYTYSNPITLEPLRIFAIDTVGRKLTYENTRADTNNYLKYRYKHLFRLDLQGRYKNVEFGWSTRYNSAMLNIDKAFVEQPFDIAVPDIDMARKKLKTTLVFDLRLSYYIKTKYKITFQVLNVLNREYMARPCDIRPPRSYQLQFVWKI